MRTHYAGHDAQYLRNKANGFAGWTTADVVEENIAALSAALHAPYIPQSGPVLEVGCGAGDLSLWLAARGYDVCGVDIAPAAIAWAREKAQRRGLRAEFQVGDVLSLAAYADNSFPFVLDGFCLHCIIGDDRALFWGSVQRVLAPGGLFHVQTMCDDPVTDACLHLYDPASRCQVYGDIATRYYGRADDIRAEAEAAGLEVVAFTVERPRDGQGQDLLLMDARKLGADA